MHRGRVCQFDTRPVPAGIRLGRREQKRCRPDTSCARGNAAGRTRLSAGCSGTRPKHTRDAACMRYRGFCECMGVRCRLAARSVRGRAQACARCGLHPVSRILRLHVCAPADSPPGRCRAAGAVPGASASRCVLSETWRPAYAPSGIRSDKHATLAVCRLRHIVRHMPGPQHLSGHVLPDIRPTPLKRHLE
jgi:hypothetical protein